MVSLKSSKKITFKIPDDNAGQSVGLYETQSSWNVSNGTVIKTQSSTSALNRIKHTKKKLKKLKIQPFLNYISK